MQMLTSFRIGTRYQPRKLPLECCPFVGTSNSSVHLRPLSMSGACGRFLCSSSKYGTRLSYTITRLCSVNAVLAGNRRKERFSPISSNEQLDTSYEHLRCSLSAHVDMPSGSTSIDRTSHMTPTVTRLQPQCKLLSW
jgi:hypothetical protein